MSEEKKLQGAEWNLSQQQKSGLRKEQERAVLVGAILQGETEELVTEHMDELSFLALTAGAVEVDRFVQRLPHPDSRTFIRSGKLAEIKECVEEKDIDVVIFDDDLTGKQTNILEETLKRKIIDRSSLILDIFAERAQTAQAKTQVELAQLQYLLPRLRGLWTHLERQRGGIGMRGPGEKEIETDRRIVRDRVSALKKDLEKIDRQNAVQRKNRKGQVRVSLVGYTNAGKSTLMNLMSKSDVFAENKLFATLDTTVRKVVLDRMPFLMSDTVGFIRKLPHHLVESFKSTLDEVRESDLHLHVVDVSNTMYQDHIAVVDKTLEELGAGDIDSFIVCNKIDAYRDKYYDDLVDEETRKELDDDLMRALKDKYQKPIYFISAITGEGIPEFKEALQEKVSSLYRIRYPYRTYQW